MTYFARLQKSNPYHDASGHFTSKDKVPHGHGLPNGAHHGHAAYEAVLSAAGHDWVAKNYPHHVATAVHETMSQHPGQSSAEKAATIFSKLKAKGVIYSGSKPAESSFHGAVLAALQQHETGAAAPSQAAKPAGGKHLSADDYEKAYAAHKERMSALKQGGYYQKGYDGKGGNWWTSPGRTQGARTYRGHVFFDHDANTREDKNVTTHWTYQDHEGEPHGDGTAHISEKKTHASIHDAIAYIKAKQDAVKKK